MGCMLIGCYKSDPKEEAFYDARIILDDKTNCGYYMNIIIEDGVETLYCFPINLPSQYQTWTGKAQSIFIQYKLLGDTLHCERDWGVGEKDIYYPKVEILKIK